MKTIASGFVLLLLAVPAMAQTPTDDRWNRWLGCWDLVTENAREGPATPDTAGRESRVQPRDAARPRVCVEAAPGGGATFNTIIGTQTPIVQTIIADGTDRPLRDDGCNGTQRWEWSGDGLRLYARAELTCKGDQGKRLVSGLAILGPDGTWTDVQSVDISGRESFRVRRYRRADEAGRPARGTAATALTLDDIKEAATKVSPRAIEAALVETRASFSLTSKKLVDLSRAGVPASVTDLMVALSYPDRFVIERRAPTDVAQAPIVDDPFMLGWAFGYPVWSDVYGLYSPLYGAFSPYYYSPFAYPFLHGYNPYFYGNGYYVVDPGGGGGGVPEQRPSGNGRVVDGQGYTRVRAREAEPATASRQPVSAAGATSSSPGSSSSGSSGSSSGGSSGGSVSGQGFSSGGGDGGGRTAQPR